MFIVYMMQLIHSLCTVANEGPEAIYANRAAIAERVRGLNSMPRKADAAVIRDGWRARGGVMSDFVTARIGWPEARGGPCEARGLVLVLNRARRVAMRLSKRRRFCRARCGGRARNTRVLRQGQRPGTFEPYVKRRQSRERPNSA